MAPLVAALEAAGFEVWWDKLMEGGAAFARTIEARLERADAVVVAWSKTSIQSDWVLDEAGRGRDRKALAPISLDGSVPPLGFRQYHAIDFKGWRDDPAAEPVAALVACICTLAGREPAAQPRAARLRLPRRALMAGGAAAAVAAVAGAGGWWMLRPGATSRNSVAVLPFANLSGDPAQAYFSDGLSEEVRAALTRNLRLRVAAPTSSNMFRDKQGDAKLIAGRLGVAYLLEGSVRRGGDVVRIAAQLIDSASGFTAWEQSFDRRLDDVLAVQSEIAVAVAAALDARLATSTTAPGGTASVAAYDAFLRGRALFNADAGEASDRAALGQFDAALALDPNYAAAHAARSRLLAAIATQYASAEALHGLYADALAAARKAVKIAPDFGPAQLSLAYAIYTGELDLRAARAPFDRAYALGRGDADILVLFAFFCARTRRAQEALEAVNLAAALDPLNARAHRALGSVLYLARQYAAVIPASEKALEINPKIANARANIGSALYLQGRAPEARAAFDAEPHDSFRLAGLAITDARLGDKARAQASLDRLVADEGDSALYQQAQVLAQWGEVDRAVALLVRAHAAADSGLVTAGADPMLDPLRKNADFSELLKKIGFV